MPYPLYHFSIKIREFDEFKIKKAVCLMFFEH